MVGLSSKVVWLLSGFGFIMVFTIVFGFLDSECCYTVVGVLF